MDISFTQPTVMGLDLTLSTHLLAALRSYAIPASPGFLKWSPIEVFSCPMLLNSEAQLLVSPALPASGQLVGGREEKERA